MLGHVGPVECEADGGVPAVVAGLWGGVVATCRGCVSDRHLPLGCRKCTLTAWVSALLHRSAAGCWGSAVSITL